MRVERLDWNDARFQEARGVIVEKRGDVPAILAELSARWQRPVTRASLDHAAQYHGERLGELLGAARYSPPAPASAGVAVSEPVSAEKREQPAVPEGIDWRGARPQGSSAVEVRVILGDTHLGAHSAKALAAAYEIVRAVQPHVIVQIGDLLNNEAFTKHAPYSPEPERYDVASMAGRAFIRSLKRAAPGAKLYLLAGNHCGWPARWEASNPAFQGAFDIEQRLGIRAPPDDDRPPPFEDVTLVRQPEEDPLILGPVAYIHGTGGGMYAARRYAEVNGPRAGVRTIVAGHHHTLQVHRHRNGCEAWLCGWLGDERHPAFHYAPPPRGWWQGVLIQHVAGDRVTTTPVPIANGAALFGGRLIAA